MRIRIQYYDLVLIGILCSLLLGVTVGRPARAIVTRADDYDAVVMGSHGGDMIGRLFVGDVARTVFERSPVPVTVVR